ncbi:occludin/ELL domain-containing protein 1, partial [Microtus ochrogaster]|uniref:Occludin/ELL domain-containing protein 1 n=1 Tax=Microtus ochrogaster TaxID=79684 RepID=A0ABM1UGC0_MICOH
RPGIPRGRDRGLQRWAQRSGSRPSGFRIGGGSALRGQPTACLHADGGGVTPGRLSSAPFRGARPKVRSLGCATSGPRSRTQIPAGPAPSRGPPGPLAARRLRSRRSGPNTACISSPVAGGRPSDAASRMPVPERPQPRPAGHEPRTLVSRSPVSRARQAQCQPAPGELHRRPRKIVFADELRPRAPPYAEKPPKVLGPRPNPVPDYELKYPPVSSRRDRSRYAAVFQDQYGEFLELQREVGATQAKLRQLEALLMSLPPPRSQEEAHVAARVWRELEKKRADPGFLDKQARCHYLKSKLRHIKAQIRKFDDQGDSDSEGSVYF